MTDRGQTGMVMSMMVLVIVIVVGVVVMDAVTTELAAEGMTTTAPTDYGEPITFDPAVAGLLALGAGASLIGRPVARAGKHLARPFDLGGP